VSTRRRRKFIRSLEHDGQIPVTEDQKVVAVFDYFGSIMGSLASRDCSNTLANLDLPQLELNYLCGRFTAAEV
jgi:hypothetical protein